MVGRPASLWPPASQPCATITSTPSPTASFAASTLPTCSHTDTPQELQVFRRRMTPMEGDDRHLLFCADADLCVIVEKGNEIDIEGRFGRRADLVDDCSEGFDRHEAHTHCPDPPAGADPESEVGGAASEGHARAGERVAAAEALRHRRRNATHRDLPLLLEDQSLCTCCQSLLGVSFCPRGSCILAL